MTHYIDIKDDQQKRQLTSVDLPLAIYSFQDSKNKLNITINKIKSSTSEGEQSKKSGEKILAYLAEDDGHLFLQPESKEYDIFHNDELIYKSVWIKSGDLLNIQHKIISFKISGDKIQIAVFEEPELIPPAPQSIAESIHLKKPETSYIEQQNESPLAEVIAEKNEPVKSVNPLRKNLLLFSLVLLILLAVFLLFARTVILEVTPEPDNIEFNGLLPAVKIGPNYIMLSGDYELQVDKTGYKSIHETIKVNSEHTRFNFKMKEKPGLVKFNIIPNKKNKIYIDNILLEKKTEKALWYEIEAGTHVLKIENKRYKTLEETIKIKGKEARQEYAFELEPDWGYISIETYPAQADIVLTPLDNLKESVKKIAAPVKQELLSGKYQLDISADKYRPYRKILTIAANSEVELGTIKLDPKPAKITFNSIPDKALLQINKRFAGKTPLTVPLKAFTEHTYSLSLAGYKTRKGRIKPEADDTKTLTIELTPEHGTVFITTSPEGAKLYIDGKRQTRSSGAFQLTEKKHSLTVKAKGYISQTKTVYPGKNSANVSFILHKDARSAVNKTVSGSVNKISKPVNKGSKSQALNYISQAGQKMILIKPAQFKMGSARSEAGRRSNEQLHSVKITYSYYLSEKEVTNKQFKLFKKSHNSGMSLGQSLDRGVQPVVNVTWDEAAQYANWLSKKEGLEPFYIQRNGKMKAKKLNVRKGTEKNRLIDGYRLPFESEWSFAARGKNNQKYPWPGSFPPPDMSGNFADESVRGNLAQYIEGYNDQHKVSAPVGTYQKNNSGFYDMGGNVSEWCQNFYSPNISFTSKTLINPTGPEKGTHHVVRDSSWRDASITELRLSYRNYNKKKANDLGFRLARYAQ